MNELIELPYWQFVLLLIFAAVMLLDRVLLPSMRWYLKRRVNRVIKEVNIRLDIEIRPFQLTRKQALIDQLIFDDKVIEAIKEYGKEHNMPSEVAQAKALKYATEIAPTFNAYIYFRLGYWLAKKVGRLIYRVRVGFYDQGKLKKVNPKSGIVFVMNHRSNMDYILVSFLTAERTAMSYAVGEWARIWPLQSLIKSMGAFFVRRNSKNFLYRRVLERYVNLATRAGVCQAVFLEGGLSRDGKLCKPKLGFMDYMLRDYHPGIDRDIVFIPVGINYDRVMEDISLTRDLNPDSKKRSTWFVLKTSFKFFYKTFSMARKARWLRFGYASVNFGKPLSAEEYCKQNDIDFSHLESTERFKSVEALSNTIMNEISQVVPILPVALMSEILLKHQSEYKSELEFKTAASERIAQLEKAGAPIEITAGAKEHILTSAFEGLIGRGFIEEEDGLYRASEDSLQLLAYYANSIEQWSNSAS